MLKEEKKNPSIFPFNISRLYFFQLKELSRRRLLLRSSSPIYLVTSANKSFCVGILFILVCDKRCISSIQHNTLPAYLHIVPERCFSFTFSPLCLDPSPFPSAPASYPPHFSILQWDSYVAVWPCKCSEEEQAGMLSSSLHMWSLHREKFEIKPQCSPNYFVFQSNLNACAWKYTEKQFQQSGMKICR